MLDIARSDAELARIFQEADFCVPESAGICVVARLKGLPTINKIPGIDLMLELCGLAAKKNWPIALVGAKPGVAEKAGETLKSKFPGLAIAGVMQGYGSQEENDRALEKILAKNPALVFAAFGIPAQEKWISAHRACLGGAAALGVGGSLDILSGNLKRAPQWMRRAELEWLFRLSQEPWRIGRVARTFQAVFLALVKPAS